MFDFIFNALATRIADALCKNCANCTTHKNVTTPKPTSIEALYRSWRRGDNTDKTYGLKGKVVQVFHNTRQHYRVDLNVGGGFDRMNDSDVMIEVPNHETFTDGDIIEFTGTVPPPYSYKTVLGTYRTVPKLRCAELTRCN